MRKEKYEEILARKLSNDTYNSSNVIFSKWIYRSFH